MVLDKEEKGHLAMSNSIVGLLSTSTHVFQGRLITVHLLNSQPHQPCFNFFPAQERVKLKQWAVEHVDRFLGTLLASSRDVEHSMIPLVGFMHVEVIGL